MAINAMNIGVLTIGDSISVQAENQEMTTISSRNRNVSTFLVNGIKVTGKSIQIDNNNQVIVDGVVQEHPQIKNSEITLIIESASENLTLENCGVVIVKGNVTGDIRCSTLNCENVKGDVRASNVTCNAITGNVKSSNVICR